MKLWKTVLILGILCSSFQLSAQSRYQAGYASISIEPDEHIFSVALQGYGAPAEGRFSLEWARPIQSCYWPERLRIHSN